MTQPRTPKDRVIHAAELYHRGIICTAEFWYQIADAMGESDPDMLLNSLKPEEQSTVRSIHRERPESLRGVASSHAATQVVFSVLLAWCERPASTET